MRVPDAVQRVALLRRAGTHVRNVDPRICSGPRRDERRAAQYQDRWPAKRWGMGAAQLWVVRGGYLQRLYEREFKTD
jgi:hypothetical protein